MSRPRAATVTWTCGWDCPARGVLLRRPDPGVSPHRGCGQDRAAGRRPTRFPRVPGAVSPPQIRGMPLPSGGSIPRFHRRPNPEKQEGGRAVSLCPLLLVRAWVVGPCLGSFRLCLGCSCLPQPLLLVRAWVVGPCLGSFRLCLGCSPLPGLLDGQRRATQAKVRPRQSQSGYPQTSRPRRTLHSRDSGQGR